MKPNISIVIACYNERNNIGTCINSLINQTENPYEIIVVDGGSKDGTILIIKDFMKHHKHIKLVHEIGNKCPANARNMGWTLAKGDYILFLDADWEFEKDFIETVSNHILGSGTEKKLLIKHPTIDNIKSVYRRYSWYGRTMPKYWMKNLVDLKTLIRMLSSTFLILLPLLYWIEYATYLWILDITFIGLIGIKSGIDCYRNSKMTSMIITIPFYIMFIFVSTGLGILSIPFLLISGKYRTGR